jgi:hypothetical protein
MVCGLVCPVGAGESRDAGLAHISQFETGIGRSLLADLLKKTAAEKQRYGKRQLIGSPEAELAADAGRIELAREAALGAGAVAGNRDGRSDQTHAAPCEK